MKPVEKAQCIVNVAKDQFNLCGIEGKTIAAMLLKALSALRLHRDHSPPDEMREAYREVRQEEADTLAGKPFVLTAQPTKEEQKKVLLWMQTPAKKNQLFRKDKRQIDRAVRFLKDYWS